MNQIFKKLLIVLLCLSLLSSFVLAVDHPEFSGDGHIFEDDEGPYDYFFSFFLSPLDLASDSSDAPFQVGLNYSYVIRHNDASGTMNPLASAGTSSSASLSQAYNFAYKQLYFYPSGPGEATVTFHPDS